MRISVIGTGNVGLVVGTCLADTGHRVTCVDVDEAHIAQLKNGEMPIYEPGLEELLTRNIEEERLRFTTSIEEAVNDCLLVFLCLGIPPLEDGQHDISAVMDTVSEVARAMDGYRIIVNKSTVPVGTTARIAERMRELTSHEFDVVANPEFTKEGAAVDDFIESLIPLLSPGDIIIDGGKGMNSGVSLVDQKQWAGGNVLGCVVVQ